MKKFSIEILVLFFFFSNSVFAQNIDELVSVNIQDGIQQGVVSDVSVSETNMGGTASLPILYLGK